MYVISSIWRHLGRHFGFFLTKSDDNNLIKWFLVPKNLCIKPTNSFLYQLFPEICYPFGGHLGRHFGFFLTKNCSNHYDNLIKWILIPKNLCIEPKNSFLCINPLPLIRLWLWFTLQLKNNQYTHVIWPGRHFYPKIIVGMDSAPLKTPS